MGAVLVAATVAAVSSLSHTWHEGYAAGFDSYFRTRAFSQMERRVPDGAIVCVLDERVYAFHGSRRQFRVCGPRLLTSPEALRSYIERHKAKFVASRRRERSALDLYAKTPHCVDAFPEMYVRFAGGPGFEMRRFAAAASDLARDRSLAPIK